MTRFILPFSSTGATLALAGGKGANLAEMATAGFPIPPGFIISTAAYSSFVGRQGLQGTILGIIASVSPNDTAAFESASGKIRSLFEQSSVPADIANQVLAAYRDLNEGQAGEPAVAVRSSATAEDLPGLAFAGQQETFLNVIGERSLLEGVVKCWASLWTARAIAYRAHNDVPSEDVALAVVVQKMVPSEASGVLFTANPLTGRRDEIVIDASFGLGEAIVAGQVEPDHYVLDSGRFTLKEQRAGKKTVAIVPRAGGGTEQITREPGPELALRREEMVALAQMGAQVAAHFGTPQDIEWAYAAGHLYLLQSRPITTLFPIPANPFPDPGVRIYFSLGSIQGVTDPFTPLGASVLQLLLAGGLSRLLELHITPSDYVHQLAGRVYVDFTDLARDPRLRNVMKALFARGDPAALAAFRRLIAEDRIPVQSELTPRQALHILRRLFPVARRVVSAIHDPEKAAVSISANLEALTIDERDALARANTLEERLQRIQIGLPALFEGVLKFGIPAILPTFASLSLAERWLASWLGEKRDTALRLMQALPGNVTTQMDLQLWALGQSIRADPESSAAFRLRTAAVLTADYRSNALPPVAQQGLSQFLDRYGMRTVGEIDIGNPRWRDDPSPVIATLLGYLELENPATAPDAVWERSRQEAERLADDLVERARTTHNGRLRSRMLSAAIRRMRALGGLREMPKFRIVQVFESYREALLDSAREMVSSGVFEQAEDIFFVPLDTLKLYTSGERPDLRTAVAAEKREYEREKKRRQIPRLLLSDGEAFYEGVPGIAGSEDLIGDPVSPGIVEGNVRVVLDPRGARLEPGDILVCPATDPGWTPLFLTAGGLVMEIGGLVTHGSVVAREYGIPAIVGVQNATTRLMTGQRVRVDGNAGRVTVLP